MIFNLTPRPPLHSGEGARSTRDLFYRDLTPIGVSPYIFSVLNSQFSVLSSQFSILNSPSAEIKSLTG